MIENHMYQIPCPTCQKYGIPKNFMRATNFWFQDIGSASEHT